MYIKYNNKNNTILVSIVNMKNIKIVSLDIFVRENDIILHSGKKIL